MAIPLLMITSSQRAARARAAYGGYYGSPPGPPSPLGPWWYISAALTVLVILGVVALACSR